MNRLLLTLLCACTVVAVANGQGIVINEVVYDSPGTDIDTWLELKGPGGMALDGYRLIGINGNGGVEYQEILLNGKVIPADGYFLITEDPNRPDSDMTDANVDYQNSPDSIQLQFQTELNTWVVVDAVGYGVFGGGDVFGGEGSPAGDQVPGNSLARCPDGRDTNDNAADFILDTNPTPGAMNQGGCGPVTGACCFVNGTCSVLTQDACSTQGGTYQGDGTACDPNPCVAQPTDRTLCEIAADNPANGRPLLENEFVRVQGLALNEWNNWAANRIEFTITDGECCTNVFQGTGTTPMVQRGDRVEVIGTVGFFNGKTQITTPALTINVLSSGNPLPDPTQISTFELAVNGESYESCLLKIRCVTITGGTWPPEGVDANLTIDDGSGPTTLRIDKDTNVDGSPAPTSPFTVVGIGGQFDNTDPYFDGYQLVLRDLGDVFLNDCVTPSGACCFADGTCQVLTQADCDFQSGSYQGDGSACDPNPCLQPEACCFEDGTCTYVFADLCAQSGGAPQGPGTVCDPNPCPQPPVPGACCFADGSCQVIFQDGCEQAGGVFQGEGTGCDPNPCPPPPPPTGACCFADGSCQVITQDECSAQGGFLWTEGGDCVDDCPPVPTERTTWGQIKANYR